MASEQSATFAGPDRIARRATLFALAAVAACLVQPAAAGDADRNAALARMMTQTKLIAVGDWDKPPNAFVEDNDPATLEIVFLKSPDAGPSYVSDDGEVIFLNPNASDDDQQSLTVKAFGIRYDKRNAKP